MNLSLNEVEALVKKACRGSGLNWGASAETAKAVRWLIQQGQDPLPDLLALLQTNDLVTHQSVAPVALDEVWVAPSGALSPIMAGLCITDCRAWLDDRPIQMKRVSMPLLAIGFLGRASDGRVLTAHTDRGQATTDGRALRLEGDWSAAQYLTVELGRGALAPPTLTTRADIDSALYDGLDAYCQRTYAPATEASRHGAGAG